MKLITYVKSWFEPKYEEKICRKHFWGVGDGDVCGACGIKVTFTPKVMPNSALTSKYAAYLKNCEPLDDSGLLITPWKTQGDKQIAYLLAYTPKPQYTGQYYDCYWVPVSPGQDKESKLEGARKDFLAYLYVSGHWRKI